ncbi:MAG: hypothetical protein J0M12_06540 [Deltaproteobacteria bacterium]|nr:hypothetical protein [Deltaproteobacteria bacterium]
MTDRQNQSQASQAASTAHDIPVDPARSSVEGRPLSRDLLSLFPQLTLYPELAAKIEAAFRTEARRLDVVFTDVDNTLVPGTGLPEAEMRRGMEAASKLIEYISPKPIALIPITGSGWNTDTATTKSVRHRIQTGEIPSYQHALITDGGMMALGRDAAGNFHVDHDYQERLAQLKAHFNPEGVFEIAKWVADRLNRGSLKGLGPINFEDVAAIDPNSPACRVYLQEHVHPLGAITDAKICFYFYANNTDERDAVERLFREELEGYSIVCCEERDFGNVKRASSRPSAEVSKYCLDITPVHKGTPVEYFSKLISDAADALQLKYGGAPLQIVTWYCGDAANDLVAARRPEVSRVVMVGGANEELIRHQPDLARHKKVYLETSPSRVGAASIHRALAADSLF